MIYERFQVDLQTLDLTIDSSPKKGIAIGQILSLYDKFIYFGDFDLTYYTGSSHKVKWDTNLSVDSDVVVGTYESGVIRYEGDSSYVSLKFSRISKSVSEFTFLEFSQDSIVVPEYSLFINVPSKSKTKINNVNLPYKLTQGYVYLIYLSQNSTTKLAKVNLTFPSGWSIGFTVPNIKHSLPSVIYLDFPVVLGNVLDTIGGTEMEIRIIQYPDIDTFRDVVRWY